MLESRPALKKILIPLVIVMLLLPVVLVFLTGKMPGEGTLDRQGFDGVSFAPVVPLKRATFVGHDLEGFTDDYAYMAAVPSSVFYLERENTIVSNPLLFYEPEHSGGELMTRTLNAHQGLDYFMEDVETMSGGELDSMQVINSANTDEIVSSYPAASVSEIQGKDAFQTASLIATSNWEHSQDAVVAVIEEAPEEMDIVTEGEISGSTPAMGVETGSFSGSAEQTPITPLYHSFNIGDGYKYVHAEMTWGTSPFEEFNYMTQRGKDPDLQLYVGDPGSGDEWWEVGCSEEWNVLSGAREELSSYVYKTGPWNFAVTYMPTKPVATTVAEDLDLEIPEWYSTVTQPSGEATRSISADGFQVPVENEDLPQAPGPINSIISTARYTIDYSLYPGVDLTLPELSPYGCRDATFILDWSDTSRQLGLLVRGPSGAEIEVAVDSGTAQTIELPELGQGNYSVAVVSLDDQSAAVDFTLKYSWHQRQDPSWCDSMASASQGAVLASLNNCPLLYATESGVPEPTRQALDQLGVRKAYLMDLGGNGGKSVAKELGSYRSMLQPGIDVQRVSDYSDAYSMIRGISNNNTLVFSTISPWSYWYGGVYNEYEPEGPEGEYNGALFVGPAAYMAAHHGCPVILTESDYRLSSAQSWHNTFWRAAYRQRLPPSVGCMVLTGRAVYEYLREEGLDIPGYKEPILTVAGQFDIGSSWDRGLCGAAVSGRICGSPVDTAMWGSRSVFYPWLVFANPAVNPSLDEFGGKRITGSVSNRGIRDGGTVGPLQIIEEEREVDTSCNVLNTWVSYQYLFNERASEYWGTPYTTATGITPYFDPPQDDMDQELFGHEPDLCETEVVPKYCEAAGYDVVYTTEFDKTMENLNRGTVMWYEVMHGGNTRGGVVGFWLPPEVGGEVNPWRGYEEIGVPYVTDTMVLQGSTAEPDVAVSRKQVGLDVMDPTRQNHDGIVIGILQQGQTHYPTGYDMDDAMGNLHSMGFSAGSCLIANSYLHLSLMRHGSVFQVIDPWLTSWYSGYAMEMFAKDIATGEHTIGESFERGIGHVGIGYLTDVWWWDIFENLVYFGDPALRMYSPAHGWAQPQPLNITQEASVSGHAIRYNAEHDYSIGSAILPTICLGLAVVLMAIWVVGVMKKRR